MAKSFYASHSRCSEPGPYRETLTRAGNDQESIARWICSFMQHPRGPESAEKGFGPEQVADLELRSVAEILAAAAERNLLEGDAAAPKVGGVCRDFALLAVSGFRAHGIPARLRVGFANYLTPGHWEDHWLCEWHDRGRWKRIDVEFAAAVEGLPFSAFDVPHDRFLTASEALLRIANEPNTASRFGVSSLGLGGEWFVAGSLFRDMAALRKLELKPWDYWGLSEKLSRVSSDWPQHARATLNHLASRLRSSETEQADGEPAALAESPLPAQVLSFPQGEPVRVVLQNA